MVNAIGVPNPGVGQWAELILPTMLDAGAAVVASVWGVDADGVVEAARLLSAYTGPVAWEVNLSCPNSEHPGRPVSHDPDAAAAVCSIVRSLAPSDVGVWAKLSPDAPDVVEVAVACSESGAEAVTVANTYPAGAAPSPEHRLGGGSGGMSGAVLRHHVRPLIEKLGSTYPDIHLIACGGVMSSEIAHDYLRLGARAVQVGTANLFDPRASHKIARGLVRSLAREATR
jgi:dihydroorotate dehydrogenase (NAD+) catalytic subunit